MRIIRDTKWYYPMEIAELKLIVNSRGGDKTYSLYMHILYLLQEKKLKGKNWGPAKAYWIVSEHDIKEYNDKILAE